MKKTNSPTSKPALSLIVGIMMLTLIASNCRNDNTQRDESEITLTVWQTETDKGANQRLAETVKRFEEANQGVKVKLESVAWSSLSSKLAVALTSQTWRI